MEIKEITLLTPEQAANYLSVSTQTLSNWRTTKIYALPYIKIGRFVRYDLKDLREFNKQKTF